MDEIIDDAKNEDQILDKDRYNVDKTFENYN